MRVLVVDDDVSVRFPLERALRKAGIETGSATSVRHAIDRLRNEPFDVLITDVTLGGTDGTTLLQWVGSFSPSTHAFIVSSSVTDEIRAVYGKAGVRIFDKPAAPEELITALEEAGPRRGFYGNAIELEFFDYVQMVALSGRDKLVEVQTPSGRGLIWFEHGDVVHCEYGEFRGETAFYNLLAVNRGTFKELFNRRAPRHTVTRSSTHLLMEAARQADEGTLGLDAEVRTGESTPAGSEPTAVTAPAAVPFEPSEPIALEVSPPVRTPLGVHDDDVVLPEEASFEGLLDEGLLDEGLFNDDGLFDADGSLDDDGLFNDSMLDDGGLLDAGSSMTGSLAEALDVPRGLGSAASAVAAAPQGGLDEPTQLMPRAKPIAKVDPRAQPFGESSLVSPVSPEDSAAMGTPSGHAIFDDPDTRSGMLDQFWQFEGINGVAIISSTGKVLAEDMRANGSLVTLAGFYMRGAARIARTLGYNVFDGVVARSVNGQQMVMVSMGAASAVLSVEPNADPEAVRDAVMGVE